MLVDALEADVGQVIDRRSESDRVDVRTRPGLELPRQLVPLGHRDRHAADHVAAVEEWPHLLEKSRPSPHRTRPGRREHLVAAEHQEIRAKSLHVDRGMRHGLRGVDDDRRADGVRLRRDLLDRVDCAEAVRGVRDGEEFRALAQLRRELVPAQAAFIVDVDHDHLRPNIFG